MKTNINILKLTAIFFLATTTIVIANNNDPIKNDRDKSKTIDVAVLTPMELNNEYVNAIFEETKQNEADFLTGIIAQWDARESSKFDSRNKPFTTVFKSNKGFAEVTYDQKGLIVSAEKRFKNVELPEQLTLLIAKRHKDWVMVQNKYNVSYEAGSDVKSFYYITLRKGNEKKVIRMNG